jgi:ATP-dependent RNA helicase DDX35
VAEEAGTELGTGTVGYAVRFDDRTSPRTRIKYVTDGVLLREATAQDPLLSSYSVIVVDEAHERNLNSDAVLGLVKKIRRKRRNLRLIVCSATINAQQFLDFFIAKGQQSKDASVQDRGTIISVDGRQYPVDVLYLAQPAPDYLRSAVETAWRIHRQESRDGSYSAGDILCFLPTGEDVDRAIRMAEEQFQEEEDPQSVDFLPLYGTLPFRMQARVFQVDVGTRRKRGRPVRRIIFATNIAEASVTVPNVGHVIDSGLVKLPYFDATTGLERLIVAPISQASAKQRAGRAGRVHAGKCYRLYTEQYLLDKMEAQTPPEILRTNLTSFILTLKALGVDNVLAFDLMDIPSVEALSHGLECLYALGAIDDRTRLTEAGSDMAAFPTEPRVSRMLLESLAEGCSWEVLAVAGALQVRELFLRKPRAGRQQQQLFDYESAMSEVADPSGDHVTYANLFSAMDDRGMSEQECRERFVHYAALRRGMEVRDQLARFLRRFGRVQATGAVGEEQRSVAIRRCVTAGFFFNVAKLGSDGRYYTLRKKVPVAPAASSVYATHARVSSEYIVFGETYDGARGGMELRAVSAIQARWLRELAPHYWE